MSLSYTVHHTDIGPELIAEIAALSGQIFDPPAIDHAWRLTRMSEVTVFCARQAGALVGFKAGYAIADARYYSWLGAVDAQHRKQGIASHLAELQHAWLREHGYRTLETSSRSNNAAMARINLKSGFVMVGSKLEPHGLQVLWAKPLR